MQVSFDPCFARCKHGTCLDEVQWFYGRYFLVVLRLAFLPRWGFFLFFFQPAGICHPCSLKKVAGFPSIHASHAANMEPVQTRFGGSVEVGGYTQLDEGAGRQIWKCFDPLNCVAPAAFRKHSTWVQIWHLGANMGLAFLGYICKFSHCPLGFSLGLDRYGSNYSSPHG